MGIGAISAYESRGMESPPLLGLLSRPYVYESLAEELMLSKQSQSSYGREEQRSFDRNKSLS